MKLRDWLILVGGSIGSYFVFKKVYASMAKPLPEPGPTPSLPGPAPGPKPLPPPPQEPQRLVAPYPVAPGRTYFAAVTVSAPLSWAASKSKVQAQAIAQGFTDVGVSDTRPAWWPGADTADYYVTGVYSSVAKNVERSHGGGQVDIFAVYQA